MTPKEPYNFSWVIDSQLAGMGFPSEDGNLLYVYKQGITCVISLTESGTTTAEKYSEFKTLPVKVREFSPPTMDQVQTCVNFIEKSIQENRAVAVHCRHGMGRTGTILACYLAKKFCINGDEAIHKLREMRPWSVETDEQEDVVRTYAKSVVL